MRQCDDPEEEVEENAPAGGYVIIRQWRGQPARSRRSFKIFLRKREAKERPIGFQYRD